MPLCLLRTLLLLSVGGLNTHSAAKVMPLWEACLKSPATKSADSESPAFAFFLPSFFFPSEEQYVPSSQPDLVVFTHQLSPSTFSHQNMALFSLSLPHAFSLSSSVKVYYSYHLRHLSALQTGPFLFCPHSAYTCLHFFHVSLLQYLFSSH